jgi:intracellular sulfur oxidation DsrE/DsrF family protein
MSKPHLTWLTALLLALAAFAAPALAGDDKINVVYHISDEEKVAFALNNMQNHIEGAGADNVNIVLVSHGPAVKRFIDIEAVDRIRSGVAKLQEQGVTFEACANTLEALNVEPDELLPGFAIAEQGGVTRIAELQSKGYAYIRP